ncbi:uncharacterized protein ARMOST_03133 [Armillaria ostoyae]|uniref:Uncharacterized protein n=1 Tax=Armillaria ostoyae TaxID=47428 RepID=A0A284QTL2_ARMOS|nr:uncharacterized protein ARMOST_03133 [Armillaria ostoyae]
MGWWTTLLEVAHSSSCVLNLKHEDRLYVLGWVELALGTTYDRRVQKGGGSCLVRKQHDGGEVSILSSYPLYLPPLNISEIVTTGELFGPPDGRLMSLSSSRTCSSWHYMWPFSPPTPTPHIASLVKPIFLRNDIELWRSSHDKV